jgi:cyclic pyranopterin phosphate synthase
MAAAIAHLWKRRTDRYSDTRTINTAGLGTAGLAHAEGGARRIEMSYIGG